MNTTLEIAWHEAGHALMAHLIGQKVNWMYADGDNGDGSCEVTGAPLKVAADDMYPAMIRQKLSGCVAQFIFRNSANGQNGGDVVSTVIELLATEAPIDKRYADTLSGVIARRSTEVAEVQHQAILSAYETLSSAPCQRALVRLAEYVAQRSPEKVLGAEVHRILEAEVG